MKKTLGVMVLLVAASQAGCASIFSGTSEKVTIDTEPSGGTCVVVGGTVGTVLVRAAQASSLAQRILKRLDDHVPESSRATLRKIDINELITLIVMKCKLDKIPPAAVEEAAGVVEILEKLPIGIVNDVLDMIGLEEFGVAPMSLKLKKGRPYAVIAWKAGHAARVSVIDVRFNAVTLLNVFNLFIGVLIDMASGAWLNLEDDQFRITLKKRGE